MTATGQGQINGRKGEVTAEGGGQGSSYCVQKHV